MHVTVNCFATGDCFYLVSLNRFTTFASFHFVVLSFVCFFFSFVFIPFDTRKFPSVICCFVCFMKIMALLVIVEWISIDLNEILDFCFQKIKEIPLISPVTMKNFWISPLSSRKLGFVEKMEKFHSHYHFIIFESTKMKLKIHSLQQPQQRRRRRRHRSKVIAIWMQQKKMIVAMLMKPHGIVSIPVSRHTEIVKKNAWNKNWNLFVARIFKLVSFQ